MASSSATLPAKERMRTRPDAAPLSPAELARLRAMLRQVESAPLVDDYLDAHEVAEKLGLTRRTVLDLAHSGAFDGAWGKAFKPAHNRLRIPGRGVDAFIQSRAVAGGAA